MKEATEFQRVVNYINSKTISYYPDGEVEGIQECPFSSYAEALDAYNKHCERRAVQKELMSISRNLHNIDYRRRVIQLRRKKRE